MKKDTGDTMSSFLPIVFTLIVISIFILVFTSWMSNISKKFEITQIERNYMLKVETQGYLSGEMYSNMMSELKAVGMEEVSINLYGKNRGEDTQQPIAINVQNENLKYGATIYLECSGDLNMQDYFLGDNIMKLMYKSDKIKIHDIRTSTLKN